jgi:hypothetical protein
MPLRTAIFALALAASSAAQAQSIDRIEPLVAKQCAVWAASQGSQAQDAGDTEAARAFEGISQYFVGLYEGMTGRSIDASRDEDALLRVEQDTDLGLACAGLMQRFGERMTAWGATLGSMGGSPPGKQ